MPSPPPPLCIVLFLTSCFTWFTNVPCFPRGPRTSPNYSGAVPKSHPERWVKIAAGIPGRTKKACMLRVKELVALQKAAKAKAPAQFTALELSVLHRAATKIFPPGVNSVAGVNRFGQIAEHLQDKCKTAWR